MRILIVEDDQICTLVLVKCLAPVGQVQTASNGRVALDAFTASLRDGRPFELVCLDIMMPMLDGQAVLKEIRAIEDRNGVPSGKGAKVIMTTALSDSENLLQAVPRCDAYLTKPINRSDLMFYIRKFGLLQPDSGEISPRRSHPPPLRSANQGR